MTHSIHLLQLSSYLAGSQSISAHPFDQNAMVITTLVVHIVSFRYSPCVSPNPTYCGVWVFLFIVTNAVLCHVVVVVCTQNRSMSSSLKFHHFHIGPSVDLMGFFLAVVYSNHKMAPHCQVALTRFNRLLLRKTYFSHIKKVTSC